MRRTILGLLPLVVIFAVPLLSCQRENSLRIVNIQNPYYSDLVDRGTVRDPETGEIEVIEVTPTDSCQLILQYLEFGPGLPTWNPYTARIEKVKVTFKQVPGMGDPIENLPPVEVPFRVTVVSDPEGKKTTTARFELMSSWYKEEYFNESDNVILEATITVSGKDELTDNAVSATAKIQVTVADLYDDPSRLGR
ncbi:MAG: hypothetical protein ABIK43_00440 [candidate division WOR-3 bacterium]